MRSDPVTTSGSASPPLSAAVGAVQPVRAVHLGGDRFDINVRGHVIRTDQPASDGGEDTGPTPTELFVASLTGCVAFYARRYLERHGLPTDGLAVEAEFAMGSRPARVARIEVRITVPAGVPVERRGPLLAVASHCTVHNSLTSAPDVSVAFAGGLGH
ncbi:MULTISPECIES: OsmC family protein [unclassified Arthrobacter]|uniref:OsmC family protein n=1 Tax=unclassified Arthrobacter TaxID=235627 RepID=UPI002DFB3417|nr:MULTISPECIES: OsmC family protein [unclassified Arthrobacter]MEC5193427.1 putative redox protein [Arthrobacter sp. MP_M4]MEC5204903.1 putative redox protein [Arthrobacter sp. MP_M7]